MYLSLHVSEPYVRGHEFFFLLSSLPLEANRKGKIGERIDSSDCTGIHKTRENSCLPPGIESENEDTGTAGEQVVDFNFKFLLSKAGSYKSLAARFS